MSDNILSYFTNGITDPKERRKYRFYKNRYCIIIYYYELQLWKYNLEQLYIEYYKDNEFISKSALYNENKIKRFFISKNIYITRSDIKVQKFINNYILYSLILKSYLLKNNYRYVFRLFNDNSMILKCKIINFNKQIYKYYNSSLLMKIKIKYFNSLIFMNNKYELDFYSKLFLIFY